MRLENLTARPHVDGNRIDLTWTAPALATEIRIRRSTRSHPTDIGDGTELSEVTAQTATDSGLRGETVYYYSVFTRSPSDTNWAADPHNQLAAMATASYDFGRQMFDMLPAIYHRYDTTSTNPHVVDRDREKGFLRRFLDLTGAQLDQLYSLARAAVDLHDPDRVDGQLLPLLAQWIGWRTDYRASVGTQRREIRNAPKIYEHIGTFEALDATARRVSGLQFRAKEYVHNVARTNEPERLNIWGTTRTDPAASWSTPELISLNYSFDGRPAHVQDGADGLLLYHTRRRHGSPQTAQPGPGPADTAVQSWDIWAKTRTSAGIWNASGPLVGRIADDKFPAAAQFGGLFWLFWETYDPGEPAPQRRRRIAFATRPIDGTTWSEPTVSGQPGAVFLGSDDAERRRPVVAVDESGLWLFWQERSGDRWDIRYNHHTGNDVTAWQPTAPKTLEQPDDSRIQDDLFLLTRPGPDKRLWLFGVRRGPQAAGDRQDRWVISYRVKNGLDPDVDDWQPAHTVPSPGGGNDREPAPVLGNGDRIEMFFSSTRAADPATPPDGTWSVFRAELSDPTTNAWSPAQPVAADLGSQRAPLAIQTDGSTLVVYRSSQPVAHPRTNGEVAIDNRDAGALTFRGKRSVTYGGFDDLQTYTFTTPSHGGRNDGRIARDAVGLFPVQSRSAALTPAQTNAAIDHLKAIAPEFLPVNTRAIFIQDQ